MQTYAWDEVEIPPINLYRTLIGLENSFLNQYLVTRIVVYRGLADIFEPIGEELGHLKEKDILLRFSIELELTIFRGSTTFTYSPT